MGVSPLRALTHASIISFNFIFIVEMGVSPLRALTLRKVLSTQLAESCRNRSKPEIPKRKKEHQIYPGERSPDMLMLDLFFSPFKMVRICQEK